MTDPAHSPPEAGRRAGPEAYGASDTDEATPRVGARVSADLEAALAEHLLGGRFAADIGQTAVAAVAVWIFWDIVGSVVALAWMGVFVLGVVLRMGYRKMAIAEDLPADGVLSVVRLDVWLSATMWGVWAFLCMGAPLQELALLLVLFAGLVAAATSTLVADAASFFGFVVLLLLPLAVSVLLGGTDREHVVLVVVIFLFAPFMLVAYRRAFELLQGQIRTASRLRVSEEETARSRDFVNALITSAPNPIVVLDEDGVVLQANPAFEHMVIREGVSDSTGMPLVELAQDDETRETVAAYLESVRAGARSVAELNLRGGDGARVWIRVSGTKARGIARGVMILILEDVTEQVAAREAMESARHQAEQVARAKSSFLASMSHEIRTPMNGILGMIELLLDSSLTDSQREAAEVIRSSGQGLLRILNDILDVSKIEAGQLDLEEIEFELPQVVLETARMLTTPAAEQGDELLVDVDPEIPRFVVGDPVRLRQVLTNLLGNAVKFTQNGEVVLSVRSVAGQGGGHAVTFSVRDTGVGIPLEKQDLIFQEFEQADTSTTRTHGGTGLGLTISRRLVELMGGELRLSSDEGKGSEFSFTLDLEEASGERQPARRGLNGNEIRGLRFLVVDDNSTARRIVQEALRSVGAAAVDEAQGVDAGLSALRSAAESGDPYQAVILDHMMPRRDGFDFAREVHEDPALADTPLLMVTSTGLGSAKDRARELGVKGFLSKPVSRGDLVRALTAVLANADHPQTERRLVTEETISRETGDIRILLAEDNAVNQQVATALLRRRGYTVDAVPDGAQAVEAVRDGAYHLVLMDIQMPVMDGLEATQGIRALPGKEDLPVVALTAHAFAEERERCTRAGMNDFLAKPFKPDDLYELVERWTQRPEADPQAAAEGENDMSEASDAAPPVDVEGFRAIMREAGIEEIVDSTLEIYREEAPTIWSELEAAVASRDGEAIRAQAHSLKSSSGNVRASRLAELLQQLESLGRTGELDAAVDLFSTVSAEYQAVMTYLEGLAG